MIVLAGASVFFLAAIAVGAIVSLSKSNTRLLEENTYARAYEAQAREKMLNAFHLERAELLNRIKPESSQYPLMEEVVIPSVDLNNDEDYWANVPKGMKEMIEDASENGIHE